MSRALRSQQRFARSGSRERFDGVPGFPMLKYALVVQGSGEDVDVSAETSPPKWVAEVAPVGGRGTIVQPAEAPPRPVSG